MQTADVVIIGAGIVGASTAYYLAKAGIDVMLVGRRHPNAGGTASQASAGGVRQQGRVPEEIPLAIHSIHLWGGLEEELEADLHYRRNGMTIVTDDESLISSLEQRVAREQSLGLDIRMIRGAELHHLIAGLSPRILAGSYCPTDGHADPLRTIPAFLEAARRLGARTTWQCPLENLVVENGRITAVNTSGGKIGCRYVVLAAALWANGFITLGHNPDTGAPRGIYCGIGHCYECRVTVDGVPDVRSCLTPGHDGMCVALQEKEWAAAMSIEKVDLVIIGAGPAGLAAAAEAACRQAKVVVLDESPIPGGRLPGQIHPRPWRKRAGRSRWSNGAEKASQLVKEAQKAGARIFCGASVWGIFSAWYVGLAPTAPTAGPSPLPAGIESRAVLVATGAFQNPLILPGWTRPGVITSGAAQTMLNVYRILPGKRAVVIGVDPLSMSAAYLMAKAGIEVLRVFLPPDNGLQFGPVLPRAAIQELARFAPAAPTAALAALAVLGKHLSKPAAVLFPYNGISIEGVRLRLRQTVVGIEGTSRVQMVQVADVRSNGTLVTDRKTPLAADVVVAANGLAPLVELAQVAGCPLTWISDLGGWVPLHNDRSETPVPGPFVAGSITGVEGAPVAEAQGRLAGAAACGYLQSIAAADLENDLRIFKHSVMKARKEAVAFYPEIAAGRAEMARRWQKQFGEKSIDMK